MVHANSNNLLAAAGIAMLSSAARWRKARRNKRRDSMKYKLKKAVAVFTCVLTWTFVDGYRTPRPTGYLRVDHPEGPAGSWWSQLKAVMRVDAIFCFLGVTPAVLEAIVQAALPFDALYQARGGRPRWLSLQDIVALGLRRLQVYSEHKGIAKDFGLTRSSCCVYMRYAERLLHDTMPTIHDARMCFPSHRLAKLAFDGMKQQFGAPPRGTLPPDEIIGYFIDGTYSPGRSCSNGDRQKLFKGKKGVGYNHIIAFDGFGHIIDASFAHPATVHDSKACRRMIERFQDVRFNTARVSGLADSAFRGYCTNGSDGRIPMYRALISENYGAVNREVAERFSAKMTTYRQCDEWANGQFKKSFPSLVKTVGIDRASQRQVGRDFLTAGFVYNLRTRRIGANQLKTVFMPLVDDNFAAQLGAKDFTEYCRLAELHKHIDAVDTDSEDSDSDSDSD